MTTDWARLVLAPPLAFVLYLLLVGLLAILGRLLAGPSQATAMKQSAYSSGEAPPQTTAAPGYRPFFVVALFFFGGIPVEFGTEGAFFHGYMIPKPVIRVGLGTNLKDIHIRS